MKKIIVIVVFALFATHGYSQAKRLKPKRKNKASHAQSHFTPTTTVNGILYTTDIPALVVEMKSGRDTTVMFTIVQTERRLYGFSVHGYGVGMPIYGLIADVSSGGAVGQQVIGVRAHSSVFPLENGKRKTYTGYLPIHIYEGSETGLDSNYIKLPVRVTVYP